MVVIDSAKALQVFADEQALRVAYYELASRVAHTGAVVMLVGEYTPEEIETRRRVRPGRRDRAGRHTSPMSPSIGAG